MLQNFETIVMLQNFEKLIGYYQQSREQLTQYLQQNYRVFESYIIYFKSDLQISQACSTAITGLLTTLQNPEYFSTALTTFFKGTPPFIINPDDPAQVAALKKIINALENSQTAFQRIENINIGPDQYTAMIAANTLMNIKPAFEEIYTALQLINESSPDIQNIAGPHIQAIILKIGMATSAMESSLPENAATRAGAQLGWALDELPTTQLTTTASSGNVSKLVYALPEYFAGLQRLISTSDAQPYPNNAQNSQDKMLANQKLMTQELTKLHDQGGLIPLLQMLMNHSVELVNAGANLTQEAYVTASAKLKLIKHTILPEVIAKIEMLEESLALKPGLLTDPVLVQMNQYYTQLSTQVQHVASAALGINYAANVLNSTPVQIASVALTAHTHSAPARRPALARDENLTVLMDSHFTQKRTEYQRRRWDEAKTNADTTVLLAATRFFNRIDSYSSVYYKWSLKNLLQSDKTALNHDYQIFQKYVVAQNATIDQLITTALDPATEGNIVSRLWYSEYKQLYGSNNFKEVSSCRDAVLKSISQPNAQAKFQLNLIEGTMRHAGVAIPTNQPNVSVAQNKPPGAAGGELRKKTLFDDLKTLKLSTSLQSFLTNDFQKYLQHNLSASVLAEINFEKLPFLEFHTDTPQVVMYKNLINAMHYMAAGLKTLEELNSDSKDLVGRGNFFYGAFNAIVFNISYSKYYLEQAAGNPALKQILQQGLDLLNPLKDLPIIGDYLQPAAPQVAPQKTIQDAWMEQQAIVAIARGTKPPIAHGTKPPTTPTPAIVNSDGAARPAPAAPDYLQFIAKQLYEIPVQLQQLKSSTPTSPAEQLATNTKIKEFMANLSTLESHRLDQNLNKSIQQVLGVNINNDYLAYLPTNATIKKRLQAQSQLQIQIAEIARLGKDLTIGHLEKIRSKFAEILLEPVDTAEFNLGLKPGTYSSMISKKFDEFFDALIVNAPIKKDQIGLDLLINTTSTANRLIIEQERRSMTSRDSTAESTRTSINTSLAKLTHDSTYHTDREKQEFLTTYAELQPFLIRVHYTYNRDFFLRELQTPKDFTRAANKILADKPKLDELIAGLAKTQNISLQLCDERIAYLNHLLDDQKTPAYFKKKLLPAIEQFILEDPIDNAIKAERQAELRLYAVSLNDSQSDIKQQSITFFENLEKYKQMIAVYSHLQAMLASINADLDYSPQDKSEKTAEILKMIAMLIDNQKTTSERLATVKAHGFSKPCQAILFKNADASWYNQCMKFFLLLLSIIPYCHNKYQSIIYEENRVVSFKQQLDALDSDEPNTNSPTR